MYLTLLHSEWPKLNGVLTFLSAIGFILLPSIINDQPNVYAHSELVTISLYDHNTRHMPS